MKELDTKKAQGDCAFYYAALTTLVGAGVEGTLDSTSVIEGAIFFATRAEVKPLRRRDAPLFEYENLTGVGRIF